MVAKSSWKSESSLFNTVTTCIDSTTLAYRKCLTDVKSIIKIQSLPPKNQCAIMKPNITGKRQEFDEKFIFIAESHDSGVSHLQRSIKCKYERYAHTTLHYTA